MSCRWLVPEGWGQITEAAFRRRAFDHFARVNNCRTIVPKNISNHLITLWLQFKTENRRPHALFMRRVEIASVLFSRSNNQFLFSKHHVRQRPLWWSFWRCRVYCPVRFGQTISWPHLVRHQSKRPCQEQENVAPIRLMRNWLFVFYRGFPFLHQNHSLVTCCGQNAPI
jgi:hypothetical protein